MAVAKMPGSRALMPSLMALSTFKEPTTRSSVAPSGRSISGVLRLVSFIRPVSLFSKHRSHISSGLAGSQLKGQSSTTAMLSSRSARARTAVDLAVPLSPRMRTPPMRGLMALRMRANFMSSWPTMEVNGIVLLLRWCIFVPHVNVSWKSYLVL